MKRSRQSFPISLFIPFAALAVASCGSPPQYVPHDGGAGSDAHGSGGTTGAGGAGVGTGGTAAGSGGTPGGTGTGGISVSGTGGTITGSGASGGTTVGSGGMTMNSGGTAGAATSSGGNVGGSGLGSGGGVTGSGGIVGTGGRVGSGGVTTGSGGTMMTTGTGGAGGAPGCSGTMKACNGQCIPMTSCCGGCSGNTPVCSSSGTCVGKSNGTACGSSAECGSTHCADGVCCDMACMGQCEACTAAGACTPTTTQRTACAGSGMCVGKCDGTAAHRSACVFPPTTMSCGAAASCTSSVATTAALCDGTGSCLPSMMTSCMFGCSSTMPICSDSCPTNSALCGGTSCVDTYSTAAHCGGSCTKCAGGTAQCYQGGCVQCLTDPDCQTSAHQATLGSRASCYPSPSHLCGCARKDSGNVLTNSGFDTGLSGWSVGTSDPSSSLSWSAADGFICQNSGSAEMDSGYSPLQQCAKITGGLTYYFGAMYLQQTSTTGVNCSVEYHANSTCTDTAISGGFKNYSGHDSTGGWHALGTSVGDAAFTAPSNATYALVACQQNDAGQAYVDQIYLNASNDSY